MVEGISSKLFLSRFGLFILLLMGALAIFLFGNPYYSLFPTNRNSFYNALITAFFLVITLLVYRNDRFGKYWRLPFVAFIAAVANLTLGLDLVRFPESSGSTVEGATWDKLSQFIKVVLPILLLVKAARFDLGSIFLQRGDAKRWIIIGVSSLVVFTLSGLFIGVSQDNDFGKLLSTLPLWIIFSFLNSFMEELWFRGLFLKHLKPLLGEGQSILLIALAFGVSHIGAEYVTPGELLAFMAPVFLLGLGSGYLMMKTDSIWGAVLLHAGADIFFAVGFTFL